MQIITQLFIEFIFKNKILYLILFFTLIAIPLQNLIIPQYYSKVIESLKARHINLVKRMFLYILGIWVLVDILNIINTYITKTLWPIFCNYSRERILDILIDRYSQNYESLKKGLIQAKINDIPWALNSYFNTIQNIVFKTSVLIISSFIYIYFMHPSLALVYTIGIIVLLITSFIYVYINVNLIEKTELVYQDYFEEIDEVLTNILSIYTNNKQEHNKNKIVNIIETATPYYDKHRDYDTIFKALYYLICILLFTSLSYYGFQLYKEHIISISVLITIFLISYQLLNELMDVYTNTSAIIDSIGTINIINRWFNNLPPPAADSDDTATTDNSTITNTTDNSSTNLQRLYNDEDNKPIYNTITIQFNNIWFKYNNTEECLYKDLNLKINPGDNCIITGPIGSGKSTLPKLIIRLHKIKKGTIYINDIDINNIFIDDIRRCICYVPQSASLFNITLWENIIYGIPSHINITEADILSTLNKSGLTDIAGVFKEKMHGLVGKAGSNLSGGQRQIVWILRALFNDSQIIVLDEPTNNLDPLSRKYVMQLIKYMQSIKNTIIITHDMDLLSLASRHIIFTDGQITDDIQLLPAD